MSQSGNVTVRMATEVQAKLEQIAVSLDRSRKWLINEAIERYLETYEYQAEKIKERLNIAENSGVFLTNQQVDTLIDSFKP